MNFENVFFDTNDFELTNRKLGEGSYGKVYIVQSNNDEKEYAAKIIDTNGLFNGNDQMLFMRESMILHSLDHPSIVKFYGINFHSFFDSSKLEPTILTEYLPNGSLKEILDKEKNCIADSNWTPTKKYICLLGISNAMKYLHNKGILHRDLKPQNILIDSDYYPRVCDFGLSKCFAFSLSKSMQLMMTKKIGTPLYMAPELLEDEEQCGTGIDVYAFGILAYEIVTGIEPFSERGKSVTLRTLLTKVLSGERPDFPNNIPEKMKELISRCWSHNPKFRPTFDEIYQLLSTDFSYFDEDVESDEVNEYIENLQESKGDMNIIGDVKKIEEEKNDIQKRLNYFIDSNDEFILGCNSLHGRKSEINSIKAINHLKKSSEKGNCYASYLLGLLYENGECVEKNIDEAFKFFERSSEQCNSHGINRIGLCYSNGFGVVRDEKKAKEYFQKAADLGNAFSISNLGQAYIDEKDYSKAIELIQKAADQGCSHATNHLEFLYFNGIGVKHDYTKAFDYFSQTAELEFPAAFHNLACCYFEGKGVKQDFTKAINYFQKAGELGYLDSLYKLGCLYYEGKVVNQDYLKALEYYQQAASLGYSAAFNNIGNMYYEGKGVNQDYSKSLIIFFFFKRLPILDILLLIII